MNNEKTDIKKSGTSENENVASKLQLSDTLAARGNLVEKVTLGLLAGGCDSLSHRSGTLCVIGISEITPYPAVTAEYGVRCRGFGGYRVPLALFRDHFSEIRFRAKGNGKDVVCGYIVDSHGNIESVSSDTNEEHGHVVLPLTPHSHALYASVPTRRGKPVWDSITVEFVPAGFHQEMEYYVSNLIMCVKDIARDVERIKCCGKRKLLN